MTENCRPIFKNSAKQDYRVFVFVLLSVNFLLFSSVSYSETLVVDGSIKKINIANYAEFYEDETNKVTVEDLMRDKDLYRFKSLKESKPGAGLRKTTWLKMSVKTSEHVPQEIIFYNEYTRFYELRFYDPIGNGIFKETLAGISYPRDSSKHFSNKRKIKSEIIPGETKTYYIKLRDSQLYPHLNFHVYGNESFLEHHIERSNFLTSYYAVMLAFLGYNVFLAFFSNIRMYRYYVAMIIGAISVNAVLDGTLFILLQPDSPLLMEYGVCVTGMIGLCFYLMFTRNFIDSRKLYPKLDRCLVACQYLSLSLLPIAYFTGPDFYEPFVLGIFNLVAFTFIVTVCVKAVIDRVPSAAYFLLAELALMWGGMLYQVPSNFGIGDPNTFISEWGLHIGTLAEVLLLSIALADRIKQLSRDKESYHKSALKAAESSNRLKSEFLSTISHELRTPMNGVIGNLELIKDAKNEENNEHYLSNLSRSADDMVILIDRILGFTEIHGDQLTLNNSRFSLNSTLQPLLRHYADKAQAKGLEFLVDTERHLHGEYYGDYRKLIDIIDALLENSLKFTDSGRLTVKIKAIETLDNNESQTLLFQIKDTGCGIPEDKIGDIFNPFQQADGSCSRQFGGIGLGLSYCQRLAELLDGTLTIESALNKGCLVNLQVPLLYPTGRSQQSNKHKSVSDDQSILIVEDNHMNQLVLKTMVTQLGYDVAVCDNGQLALQWLESNTPSIILMDCQMPVMDGFEATQEIRKIEDTAKSQVPILAVTANVLSGDRENCLSVGMDDYIKKPIKKSIIEEKLNYWVGRANTDTEANAGSSHAGVSQTPNSAEHSSSKRDYQ